MPHSVCDPATPAVDAHAVEQVVDVRQILPIASLLQGAIFNSANFSSIATDARGVIQIFNVGAERMLGYAASDVMNRITPADISDPREVMRSILSDAGLHLDVADDGAQALRMEEQNDYALILMDTQMPEIDGLAATRAIRLLAGRAGVPIVAMTANAFDEDREQCRLAGMNDFLSKPVDPPVMFSTSLRWLAPTGPARVQ